MTDLTWGWCALLTLRPLSLVAYAVWALKSRTQTDNRVIGRRQRTNSRPAT